MTWRLGLDVGTNSLGWAAIELEGGSPAGLRDAGVRIFSDGRTAKSKESKAAERRLARGMRRNRDRSKRRQERLMRQLIKYELMPDDAAGRKRLEGGKGIAQQEHDPWILRTRALDEKLDPHRLGRAIFHLGQRRGFKSNRKTDRADAEESGKVKEAIARTEERLKEQGARTLGELFGRRRLQVAQANAKAKKGAREAQPLARVRRSGEGSKWQYVYYPTRDLILKEFDLIWARQAREHPEILTDEAKADLRATLDFQYPLKPQPVGKCTFIPGEERAPKALPGFQRFRIYQELNNLRIRVLGEAERSLSKDQRDTLAERLLRPTNKTGKVTFKAMRKLLGLSQDHRFNLESNKRKDLDGDKTAAVLMQDERWGQSWFDLDRKSQDEIVARLVEDEDSEALEQWLVSRFDLSQGQAGRVADAPVPDAHCHLSKKAIDALLSIMERDVIRYDEAAAEAFGDHSNFATGELHDRTLPYYGRILEQSVAFGTGEETDPDEKRYGKVANPTVHVALNQIKAVMNDLIKRFGRPDEVVIEVARDLPLSARGKSELEKQQRDNQKANEERATILEERGFDNNRDNRVRLRLFEELDALDKQCVFTGEQISLETLFSDEVEVEHLLPRSLTFDDRVSNLVLCKRRANRDKGNRSPYDAFGHSPAGYSWEDIIARAEHLPDNKKWRFAPDAMERFEGEENFRNRQLNDTRYVARLARSYAEAMYGGAPKAGGRQHVWVVTGGLTSDLRWVWGLDRLLFGHNLEPAEAQKKNRQNHRHHAIDAIVVALTDRGLVKHAADLAQENEKSLRRFFEGLGDPWPGFFDDVRRVVDQIIISHKPDHGFVGKMHNETAYGLSKTARESGEDKPQIVVTRKPLDGGFEKPQELKKIRDPQIREALLDATYGLSGKEFKAALIDAGDRMRPQVRRVRIEETLRVIPIRDRKTGRIYKGYKGDSNYCYDIWMNDKGKWTGEVVSTFEAYQRAQKDKDWWRKPVNGAGQPLLMRLRKNDMLKLTHEGREMIVQVVKFSPGQMALAEHFEANVDARARDKDDPLAFIFKAPSALQKAGCVRVTVSPSGVVTEHKPQG